MKRILGTFLLILMAGGLFAQDKMINLADVFRDPSAVPAIADEAVAIKASYMWLQFGVISAEGVTIAEAGDVQCIVDKCIKIEHARYMGRMHWLGFNTDQISAKRKPS